jgi:H+/gluconate symporter-like permease
MSFQTIQRHWVLLSILALSVCSLLPLVSSGQVSEPNKQSKDSKQPQDSHTAQSAPNTGFASGATQQKIDETDKQTSKRVETLSESDERSQNRFNEVAYPMIVLVVGIIVVLGLIIVFKFNAFIALIIAAIIVSLMAPGEISGKISRVANSFGSTAGGIAIVIALAAVIGKCMLDSGAADRIVRMFLSLLGVKRAPLALMGSGFVLAIPVFFDTVFYLLVPLARSLHRKTGRQYLTYIMAIAAGGAVTHTLVPPTPGPLLMAANLGIDVGRMILIGSIVAFPAALAGLMVGGIADRLMKTPMRDLPGRPEPKPLPDEELPALWLALAPVLLPIILISAGTVSSTIADSKQAAIFREGDIVDWNAVQLSLREGDISSEPNVARKLIQHAYLAGVRERLLSEEPLDATAQAECMAALNRLLRDKQFYDERSFLGVLIHPGAKSKLSSDLTRQKPVDTERMNRLLLESAYPESVIRRHEWELPSRKVANVLDMLGNANLALLISALIALSTLYVQRGLTLRELGLVVEDSLMSGGVIILITAAGGAFGGMLQQADIAPAIQQLFQGVEVGEESHSLGMFAYLALGFAIAAVLKVAQGSSTVAMIIGSAMMAAIIAGNQIGCHPVYLATSIGAGSLIGSWMNDSGFWIFAKMGGLTEAEALKSWTIMLIVMGLVSFGVTLLMAWLLPLV